MQKVTIPINSITLEGLLSIPKNTKALVIFAHGSGSSRHSSRNNFVARILNKAGFATLLFDLLTEKEDLLYKTRFNIELLTERLIAVTNWLKTQEITKNLSIGYFGASTGAAAALEAAANLTQVKAIVSRGGRPDLAMDYLSKVTAPTLLIVGGHDEQVIEMNKTALEKIIAEKNLEIVPDATHLFEEPGTLEEVAQLAVDWFTKYLPTS